MTIEATTPREVYATNGATTVFPVPFKFLANADLVVLKTDSDGGVTTLVLDSDYTLTGAGDPDGGSVTISPALASGYSITIYLDPPLSQQLDLVQNDDLNAENVENTFDKLTMIAQRLRDLVNRAFRFSDGDVSGASLVVPSPQADSLIGWASDGLSLVNKSIPSGTAVYTSTANTRLGTSDTEAVTPDALASIWQEGGALVAAASIAKPSDSNLGGYYTQSGATSTGSYWDGVKGGEEMEIRYTTSGALLLASGNLIPPGGTTFTLTTDDVIRWRWDASLSKWRAVSGWHGATGTPLGEIAFSANKGGSNQSISATTDTKVTFTTEDWDTAGFYDAANSKFQPTVPGRYQISVGLWFSSVTDQQVCAVKIFKSGSEWRRVWADASGTGGVSATISAVVNMNGTTDYIEVYAYSNGATTVNGIAYSTWFTGAKIGG